VNWAAVAVVLIGIVFSLVLILYLKEIKLRDMADSEYARGVITLLITFAFVILGLVLIIAALFLGSPQQFPVQAAGTRCFPDSLTPGA